MILLFSIYQCCLGQKKSSSNTEDSQADTLKYDQEVHFKNVKQLTFGGNNAEAYFSFDNKKLVFQSDFRDWGVECDQIFTLDMDATYKKPKMISTGNGRTTCAYFLPGNHMVVYASTHQRDEHCPKHPDRFKDGKYVWPIYHGYDIYVTDLNGKIQTKLTDHEGYDAEPTVSPNGEKIVFTSLRSGALDHEH